MNLAGLFFAGKCGCSSCVRHVHACQDPSPSLLRSDINMVVVLVDEGVQLRTE